MNRQEQIELLGERLNELKDRLGDLEHQETPEEYTLEAHASTHQHTGTDQINVGGLSGDLADAQDPKAHASTHQDAGADELDVTGLTGAGTLEFFVPATAGTGSPTNIGCFAAWQPTARGDSIYITFAVPANFTTIVEAVVVTSWDNTTTTNAAPNAYSHYAAVGESYDTHGASKTDYVQTCSDKDVVEWDIEPILSLLNAGDYVGIRFQCDGIRGEDLKVLGIRFKYS